jgi:serine phosphatase RsbU (regulator of sigma subunit)
MASLILLKTPDGSATGERVPLKDSPLVIGRSPDDCQIVLPPNAVSRKHAQITNTSGQFFIEDLGSRNKTFVNNKEVAGKQQLRDGDGIKICDFLFCFRDDTKPKPAIKTPPPPEEEEAEGNTTTIEASAQRVASDKLFDNQPIDKLRAILNISNALSKTFEVDSLLPKIADELLSLFKQADRCFIIEYDSERDALIPTVTKSRRPSQTSDRFSKTIVRKALQSLESYLSEDAQTDKSVGAAQSIADFKIRSVMCVPLATQDDKPLGVIQLDSQDRLKKFTKDDLQLLTCVANQASIAIENARMHVTLLKQSKLDEENKAATKVQRGFLPQRFPNITGYEFFSHYLAARTVGGDYYDFISLPNQQTAVLLGDVSGKGVPAALLMARVSGEARVCMLTCPNVAVAITQLNEQLLQANLEDRYITLAAAVLDPMSHQITLVNAGHITPAIYHQTTGELEKCVPEDISGFPVGWVPGYEYQSITCHLAAGDTLILFTDGILDAEAADGTRFGEDGVLKALKLTPTDGAMTARTIGDKIIRGVQNHAQNHPQFDDIALVCFGRAEEAVTVVTGNAEGEIEL